jgi:L-alanine-DL-glutamate epimerase-like enolase superfamily enzyme
MQGRQAVRLSARGWVYGTRSTCLVEISRDEGITGWGECYASSTTVNHISAVSEKPL